MPNDRKPVALVTGAGSGLGNAIARKLVASGYQLILADIDAERIELVARDIGGGCVGLPADVAVEADWVSLMKHALDAFGGLDLLVNNAAIYDPKVIADQTIDGYQRVFAVNQLGVFLGIQAAVAPMRRRKGGVIINISSTGGLRGYAGTIAYASTKWAVRGMTKVAAVELAQYGIRVNSIHPGLCETPMAYENTPELLAELRAGIPAGRLGEPAEVAAAVAFLASPEAAYISGAELAVDGAATA